MASVRGLGEVLVRSSRDGTMQPVAVYVPLRLHARPPGAADRPAPRPSAIRDAAARAVAYIAPLAEATGTIVVAPWGRGYYDFRGSVIRRLRRAARSRDAPFRSIRESDIWRATRWAASPYSKWRRFIRTTGPPSCALPARFGIRFDRLLAQMRADAVLRSHRKRRREHTDAVSDVDRRVPQRVGPRRLVLLAIGRAPSALDLDADPDAGVERHAERNRARPAVESRTHGPSLGSADRRAASLAARAECAAVKFACQWPCANPLPNHRHERT